MLNRKGFTLIELLIVVVIIGILAAIAIPKFANTKEKATVASMKSDLRNMATAQEGYYADFNTYTNSLAALNNFQASGQNVLTVNNATLAGWDATATNASLTGAIQQCHIAVGDAVGNNGTTTDGVVICTP